MLMTIVPFTADHVDAARQLALQNYNEERAHVPALPEITETPLLGYYVRNGLGYAALDDNGNLLGFLCCYEPWEGAFDAYDALGTFSPAYAHGAVKDNRKEIYQRLYQACAALWAEKKIVSHGFCAYEHDTAAKEAFFDYGFGKRCVDQIRLMDPIPVPGSTIDVSISFRELPLEEFPSIRETRRALNTHLKQSPCFLQTTTEECNTWLDKVELGDRRTFVAEKDGQIIAYLDVEDEGECFMTDADDMMNLQGAYCRPEYRGQYIVQQLLNYVMDILKAEGNVRLGVDHESYNPNAAHFWGKLFQAYTCSMVRRIEIWAMDR